MATRTGLPGSGGSGDVAGTPWDATAIDKLPGGLIGYVSTAGNQTGITTATDITSLTITITPNASRNLKISFKVNGSLFTASSNDVLRISLFKDGTQVDAAATEFKVSNQIQAIVSTFIDVNPTNASHTYKLQASVENGTGTWTIAASSTNKNWLLIEDVGVTF